MLHLSFARELGRLHVAYVAALPLRACPCYIFFESLWRPSSEFYSRFCSLADGKRLAFVTEIPLEGSILQQPYKVLDLLIGYCFVSNQISTESCKVALKGFTFFLVHVT